MPSVGHAPGRIEQSRHGVVVYTPGSAELDLADCSDLMIDLDHLLSTGCGVVIDVSAVTFIDSTALSALVRCRHHASKTGQRFALVTSQEAIQRILVVTALEGYFPVYATLPEVLTAWGIAEE